MCPINKDANITVDTTVSLPDAHQYVQTKKDKYGNISYETIRRWVSNPNNRIGIKVGGRWRVRILKFVDFLENKQNRKQ
jgi:hypothetical protein